MRTYTLTAALAASAGAPLGSANYLYYRLSAVNKVGSKTVTKAYPNLQAVIPQALGTDRAKNGTDLRVATFNVRTVKATKDKRNWLLRIDDVANEILTSRAGVVLLQEISPGRADGKGGSTAKVGRQTTTLLDAAGQAGRQGLRLQDEPDDPAGEDRRQARAPRADGSCTTTSGTS